MSFKIIFKPVLFPSLTVNKRCLVSQSFRFSHQHYGQYNQQDNHRKFRISRNELGLLFAAGTGLTFISWYFIPGVTADSSQKEDILTGYGNPVKGLPSIKMEEVSKHDCKERKIWVTFKSGVYDVTSFIESHPGGDKILMAAGASVDPFWELYAVHKSKTVLDLLESYRIGNLAEEDRETSSPGVDHWSNEPKRHRLLAVRSDKPFNAEPPPELLVENHVTPNELFFVRNHLPVPVVDEQKYRLEISGIGVKKPVSLSLKDLKTKFPTTTVTTTIQCAGNRRSEMNRVKEVKGLFWGNAAISTASWTGVRLLDVLKYYKCDIKDPLIKHVQFDGLDTDPVQGTSYGASIPVDRALNPDNDIILAFEMNGKVIPRDHGFPVRVIIPGVVGARQVKWLHKITMSSEESDSHWQQRDYKGFNPSTDASNADWKKAKAIQDYPVQAAICLPGEGETVSKDAEGMISVKGYAWSGGGRAIARVDVSGDGGKTWVSAKLKPEVDDNLNKKWDWTLWEAKVAVEGNTTQLVCKATDSSYNTQPEGFEGIWNFRGVLSHAWNRVNVKIKQ